MKRIALSILALIILIFSFALLTVFAEDTGCNGGDCWKTKTPTPTVTPTVTPTRIPPTPTPEIKPTPRISGHKIYLPIVTYNEYDCQYQNMGAAWMYRTQMPFFLRDMFCIDAGFSGYYKNFNQATWQEQYNLPILWDERDTEWSILSTNTGWVQVINEPDQGGQANMTPQETADYIYLVEQNLPNVIPVWWNGNNPAHLSETVDLFYQDHGRLPKGILGIHGYLIGDPRTTFYKNPDSYVDAACGVLARYTSKPCQVIVTEIGICNANEDPDEIMQIMLDFIMTDPRVIHTYWFTHYPDSPHNWDTACNTRFWIDTGNNNIWWGQYTATETGKVLWEFIHDYEFPVSGLPEPFEVEE